MTDEYTYLYKYDAAGRLREVSLKAGNILQQKFWYDHAGRRVKKEDRPPGATAHGYYCLWSGEQVVVEYQTLVGTTFPPGTQPEPAAASDTPSDLRYMHWDLLSVRLVTDGNGNQVDTQSHDAYGGEIDGGGEVPPFFTTYERELTELDYARARYYRSNHRRFTSPDSYRGSYRRGSPQSLNRYAYVRNDPINYTDPTGLFQAPPRARWEDLPINDPGPPPPPPVNPPPSPCIADENGECPPPSNGSESGPCSDAGIKQIAERIKNDSSIKGDCRKMIAIMREAFRVCPSYADAMDKLLDVLAGGGIPRVPSSVVFGQSGFNIDYRDSENTNENAPFNQVRHFIAWFYAGYFYDSPITQLGGKLNEFFDRRQNNQGDLRLSRFGYHWGRQLRSGEGLDDVLSTIEQKLCE